MPHIRLETEPSAMALGITNPVVAVVQGVRNIPTKGTALEEIIQDTENNLQKIVSRARQTECYKGFKALFAEMGYPDQISSFDRLANAVEARGFKSHGVLVDTYNIVSLRYGAPIGCHDYSKTDGTIVIGRAMHDSRIQPMFQSRLKLIAEGDLVYSSDGRTMCWMGKKDIDSEFFSINQHTAVACMMSIGNRQTTHSLNENICIEVFELLKKVTPDVELELFHCDN